MSRGTGVLESSSHLANTVLTDLGAHTNLLAVIGIFSQMVQCGQYIKGNEQHVYGGASDKVACRSNATQA